MFPGKVFLPEIPSEGIFFIFQHSLFLASRPCLTLSVVPNMSPYCSWFVSLMFQTRSFIVSYLSHRCLQICLLCCVCSQTLSKHILLVPVLVRAVFQKHAFLACSRLLQPCSKCSLSHLHPVLGQTLIHFLPSVWVQTCVLLASPLSAADFHSLFLEASVSPLQDTLHLFTVEEMGAEIYRRRTASAAPLELGQRQLVPSAVASGPAAPTCLLPSWTRTGHLLLKNLGKGQQHCSAY